MNLLRIKIENLLAICYLPIGLINITKADAGLIFTAIILQVSLIAVLHYGVKTTRKDLIEIIKENEETLEEIKEAIASYKETIATILKDIKKEVIRKQTKNDQVKRCFLNITSS